MIARSGNPPTVIPVPHGLFADAQARRELRRCAHPRVPQTRQPVLQAVRAAALGDMHGLEWQPGEGRYAWAFSWTATSASVEVANKRSITARVSGGVNRDGVNGVARAP